MSRDGAFGMLMGAAVGTLFLVPVHGSAQDSLSVACADVYSRSPLEDLTRCAEQGHAGAQSALGFKYARGVGVPEDDVEAVCWYRLAAEQGLATAQLSLGTMYNNGEGVPEDDAEAVRWYRLAAEQGYDNAQGLLGLMYERGEGVPEDLVLAYMWLNLSAAQGNEISRNAKDRVESRGMTREQIAEAQRLSREWIETHPQGGGN